MQNSKPPLITIAVLNYNGLEYLKQTIPNILKIAYPNLEILIVDNGSSDGSCQFIKSFQKIVLYENISNLGYSKGKNLCVKYAKGEYVLLIDNDVLFTDLDFLSKLLTLFSSTTAFVYVPCVDKYKTITQNYGLYYGPFGVRFDNPAVPIKIILEDSASVLPIGSPDGKNLFFKKETWNELGGYDEVQEFNIDDIDIGPRAYLLGYQNILYTKTYFQHLGIANTLENTKSSISYSKRYLTLFSGHARSMLKNYLTIDFIARFPLMVLFYFAKAIKYSVLQKNIGILFNHLISIFTFILNLPTTLMERRQLQNRRVVRTDEFLRIKTPVFK